VPKVNPLEKSIADALKRKVTELEDKLQKTKDTAVMRKKIDDFDSFL